MRVFILIGLILLMSCNKKEIDNKKQDVFYWSEGSVSFGRIGDTDISSSKIIETEAITFGSDRFTLLAHIAVKIASL